MEKGGGVLRSIYIFFSKLGQSRPTRPSRIVGQGGEAELGLDINDHNITLIISISLSSSQYHSDHCNITLIIAIPL